MPLLRGRWPSATLGGIDSSAEMLSMATREHSGDGITYERADVREWIPVEPVDVIVTSATLQ
jgi:trans-aconitate 2-methyltransferase